MPITREELIADLQAQITPIEPQDSMAEAGRKALLDDVVKMLHHEAGSRIGDRTSSFEGLRLPLLYNNQAKPRGINPRRPSDGH